MSARVDSLTELFADVRGAVGTAARDCEWPEFERLITEGLTQTQLPAHVVLPLASAQAVGGKARNAVPVAAACCYLIAAMRWLDDCADRDRSESLWNEIGSDRAVNMAAAALTVAWRVLAADECIPSVARRAFGRHTVSLAHGQDIDLLSKVPETLDDYWHLMRQKTGSALALACEVGALSACPEDSSGASACSHFGWHMGTLLQILDDLDGTFHPDGLGDLYCGKATLPVLYGLAISHPARTELQEIVGDGTISDNAERVREILEAIDTREFLVWCAFEEHRQALSYVKGLELRTGAESCAGLNAFADLLMIGWEDLLSGTSGSRTRALVA